MDESRDITIINVFRIWIIGVLCLILISCEEPIEFQNEDVVGTWVRTHHGCVDTLKIRADNTYAQIYEDSNGNIHVEEHEWHTRKIGIYKYLDLKDYKYIYPGGDCRIDIGYGLFPVFKSNFGGSIKIMIVEDANYYYFKVE